MDHATPSDADYTTSTNPERFAGVVDCAEQLVAELLTEFVVERSDGDWSVDFPRLVGELTRGCPDPVRLDPSAGVPIVFGFTSAPGVAIRVGRNVELLFPACLCDACNHQVDEVCDDLRFHVEAVTSGSFTEVVTRRAHRWAFEVAGMRHAGDYRPRREERRALGDRGEFRSEPWKRRTP